ncbi:hypothetical protein VNI00_012854 [Paramarasmius palmivorus]|uniref:Laccase n=1 Tax=Paramarasmius palmivorus TaxID=297713 RepID=A0AAW0BYS2_9AGAR
MRHILLLVSAFASLANGLEVIDREGDFHVVNTDIAPDGFQRTAVLAGKTSDTPAFPGPLIKANKGDKFRINVHDELTDLTMDRATTIHWHGLFQRGTNWADGPDMVTQCPIVPGNSFEYRFAVPHQSGTYWYHSHFRAQYCDGLRGPLVIYDPNDPHKDLYDVDDENTIITLADWYHRPAPNVVASQISQGPPSSDSTLINGLGRWRLGNETSPLAIINVEQGKRYRMRLVSLSCDPSYLFSIDSHNMTIIEADGESVEPHTVNKLDIFAAQRYSFILNADQPVGNYWIRAVPQPANLQPQGFDKGINSAILRYKGAENVEPDTTEATDVVMLRETDLHYLSPNGQSAVPGRPVPGGADLVLNLTLGFAPPATFMINGTPFAPPNVPVLLQILSGAQAAQDLLPAGSVYTLPANQTIEINFRNNNTPGDPHPMHLHGHSFDVVKSADSPVYNFKDPVGLKSLQRIHFLMYTVFVKVRRDTVAVAGNNITTIRFVSDNAGPWFLHCHIDFHLVDGLAVVLAEDTRDTKLANPVPADWSELCPIWNNTDPSIRN